MRTSLRVGMLIGGIGSIALSVLQARIGLVVAPCLILAGIISGFAVAKWLDRPSYGHQIAEGVRAGLLSCGLPGFVALLSLLVAGPRDVATLAESSHFFGLDFSQLVFQLSNLGWAGVDVLALTASAITGIVWSAALVQIFAWSKNSKAVRVVQRARLAAVSVQRTPLNVPALAPAANARSAQEALVAVGAGTGALAAGGYQGAQGATAGPAVIRRSGAMAAGGGRRSTVIDMSPPIATAQVAAQPAPQPVPAQAAAPAAAAQQQASEAPTAGPARGSRTPRGKTSAARRMENQLNQQMRQALEAWAEQEDEPDAVAEVEDEPTASGTKRSPKPSTFLNSDKPAKRSRKKNQTRDWLC